MSINAKTLKHITVTAENYNKLKKLGNAGDSFNDVIARLLESQK
ncbi:MAG: antitoxin VapB family protein [Candidatus Nitrosotenuis sp.]|nr:antitoxin VapB family protein [Candidatus Nitrosotenuis sp.]